ncbi:Exonuclease 1 [Seminavis robusta]|uniref:Exonuclease 1 n=1 Tax=Seminavis robusta TaxID=568900 RepID=A0A9N8F1W0_9STRA|nr:Exonuclease 1 [Seminavis robusta]|eukprot:Sro2397_g326080.1 Exonuclease 1 (701) ;mRNA; r:9428-11530
MGIVDFLPTVLAAAATDVDLRKYRDGIGMTVRTGRKRQRIRRPLRIGVDIAGWIYRATMRYGNMLADENHLSNYGRYQLMQQQQQQNQKDNDNKKDNNKKDDDQVVQQYVANCCLHVMERLQSLQKETNAELLAVLDGDTPPIKKATTTQRSEARRENERVRDAPMDMTTATNSENSSKEAVQKMERERTKANKRAGAGKHFSRIVEELIYALRINQIPFLVAPYEADGQLAWLSNEKFIDLVITEDSDMVAQGGKCMLYKYKDMETRCDPPIIQQTPTSNNCNQNDNNNQQKTNNKDPQQTTNDNKPKRSFVPRGKLLLRDDLGAVTISRASGAGQPSLCLRDLSDAALAVMFVAAGCDYWDSLKGIGLKTACDIVNRAFLQPIKDELSPLDVVFQQLFQRTYDRNIYAGNDNLQKKYKEGFLAALVLYRHPIVYNPFKQTCEIAHLDTFDPELMSYDSYRNLLEDEERLKNILGEIIEAPMATFIAEGWVSSRSKRLFEMSKKVEKLPKALQQHFHLEDPTNDLDDANDKQGVEDVAMTEAPSDDKAAPTNDEEDEETQPDPMALDTQPLAQASPTPARRSEKGSSRERNNTTEDSLMNLDTQPLTKEPQHDVKDTNKRGKFDDADEEMNLDTQPLTHEPLTQETLPYKATNNSGKFADAEESLEPEKPVETPEKKNGKELDSQETPPDSMGLDTQPI